MSVKKISKVKDGYLPALVVSLFLINIFFCYNQRMTEKRFTTPKSILIGSILIALAIIFRVDENVSLVPEAKAEIAGMSYWDLRTDYDFKKAVKYIVENCDVYDTEISC
ncbi:MAG: hypothetical protein K0U19_01320 [Proteobacteria bacterium]|nr:hypothetical protein [Pseudomonadota bacterium]